MNTEQSKQLTEEERGHVYARDYPDMDDRWPGHYLRDGYIRGACEQKQIDIEKACQWWREALQCGINPCNGNERIEEFKQFMEQ